MHTAEDLYSAMYCSIQHSSRFSGTLSLNGYDRQALRPSLGRTLLASRPPKATRLTLLPQLHE